MLLELRGDRRITFSGTEDIVRCYACDGGLRKWDPEDDPWIEHAHWFPHCVHVLRERGQEYIDLIQVAAANEEEVSIIIIDQFYLSIGRLMLTIR